MEEVEEQKMRRCKNILVAHRSDEHHVASEQGFHPLD